MRRTPATLLALCLTAVAVPAAVLPTTAAAQDAGDPAVTGSWGAPFEEPDGRCEQAEGDDTCKPAAGSIGLLPNGKVVYWDALDSMEDADVSAVAEFGDKARNDMARVLDLRASAPVWISNDPNEGVPPGKRQGEYLPGGAYNDDEDRNDADLFCSDQVFLADGRILDVGGTHYYQEPGVPGQPTYGVVELEGLKNARIYDPQQGEGGTWSPTGEMTYGRWYPSVVTLPDSSVLALSGVTKLIKPLYPDRPSDSGRNVTQSEVYEDGAWRVDGGDKSLPLYPRVRLLPNGNVYYDAAGQTFNPAGQAYDEALWNMAAVYDPESTTWRDLGLPEFGDGLKGFRGSAFSQMLPLRPDESGEYREARFLSAGGVYGVTPGTYAGTDTSTLNTVTIGEDGAESFVSENTGSLNNPRWYSTGVSLPTGEVIAFSGADRDEVVAPGSGTPETTPEIFDPETGTWTELADAAKGRTYHNSATLLMDGSVLVGGHAPIATGYGKTDPTLRDAVGFSDPFRDPSFEIFSPPYLHYGDRPVITEVADPGLARGSELTITTPDAEDVDSVVLVRNTAMTHLVDSDQRTVELPVVRARGGALTVQVPDEAAVLPDGPYMLFLNEEVDGKGTAPSVARQVFVNAEGIVPPDFAGDVSANNTAAAAAEQRAADGAAGPGQAGAAAAPASGAPAVERAPVVPAGPVPTGVEQAATTTTTRVQPVAARARPARTDLPAAPVVLASLLLGSAVLARRRALRS